METIIVKTKKTQIQLAMLLLGLALTTSYAQQATNATGSTAVGTGGSATYSVGQIANETNTSAEGSVAQGVQHAYEIFEVSEGPVQFREIYKGVTLSVSAKLTPNTDLLLLQIPNLGASKVTFQLFTLQGKLVQSHNITQMQTDIDMNSLSPAPYFAKIMQGNVALKTFKIIKN
jgi:hypothetical protein